MTSVLAAPSVPQVKHRPRLLDLFCGAGGAGVGYFRAGFDVVGVDKRPVSQYPFEFIQSDALAVLADSGFVAQFDAIHASPPCQAYSIATRDWCRANHPDLLAPTRDALSATGLPWVIENVPGAPMRVDLKLCGCMFGLPNLRRERWFETSWHAFDLRPPCYHAEPTVAVISGGAQSEEYAKFGHLRGQALHDLRARAMGINWMDSREDLALAIPPAYTEYIGRQLLSYRAAAG